MNSLVAGSISGLTATIPMTFAMSLIHKELPEHEQYPLPPRQITMNMAETAGVSHKLDEEDRTWATLAGHFAFGTAMGALYAPLMGNVPLPPVVKGIGFGLAVWAGSYLGWLPAVGLLSPATEHPPRRTALMIAAHVVWGAVTGLTVEGLDGRQKS